MALLATNYIHVCKETLWLFGNIVNCESVVVQEQLVELDLMDKLEYHTIQAVQKLDPYAMLNMWWSDDVMSWGCNGSTCNIFSEHPHKITAKHYLRLKICTISVITQTLQLWLWSFSVRAKKDEITKQKKRKTLKNKNNKVQTSCL